VTIRRKLGRGAAVLSAVGALGLVSSAVQATAAEAATYGGRWSITAGLDGVTNTRSYVTASGKVSTCVSVTSTEGVGGSWSYQLIWYDGGRNKVIWHSGDYEGHARVCSPVKRPGGRNDKVYDHIILYNAGADPIVKDAGTYSFNTY
jgi:hypothetical protein